MTRTSNLGLLMGLLALCILLAANLVQVVEAHGALQQVQQQQKDNDATIAKIDAQLDSLASAVQRLAAGGNPNAAKIVTTLAENGIHIKARR